MPRMTLPLCPPPRSLWIRILSHESSSPRSLVDGRAQIDRFSPAQFPTVEDSDFPGTARYDAGAFSPSSLAEALSAVVPKP